MIHDKLYAGLVELVKDTYRHGSVRERGEKGDRPSCGVFTADRDFIPPLNAGSLEIVMQPVNFTGKILVMESLALEVAHGRHFPVIANTLFNQAQKGVLIHLFNIQ